MRMQMNLNNIISLLGGVALFLFGMTLMGDGLKKVAGSKLELVLYRLSGTPLRGVLLGKYSNLLQDPLLCQAVRMRCRLPHRQPAEQRHKRLYILLNSF